MAIFHLATRILSRASGRSAIASAAYRAGEKLRNEETGLTHDFTNKGGVIMNEIILPENAPPKYEDREVLWNDVQRIESRSDARFAREIEVALPIEMTREEQIECVRNYINENFTSIGMIADWALHDKGDGNPHAHIMLTCRGINEKQEWDTRMRSVFANDRDDNGRAIYNPELPTYDPNDKEHTSQYRIPKLDENGEQKFRERPGKGKEMLWERINIPTNDWNNRENVEKWRESWAINCNRYLEPENHIDHRSYERQGIDKEPTIHEGVTARKIEADGNISDRVQINREIKERNTLREQMKQLARDLTEAITEKAREIYERFNEFIRCRRDVEQTGADVEHPGVTAIRDRESDNGEQELEGRDRRIEDIKQNIDATEQFIDTTNQRINELHQIKLEKERELDERLQLLRLRRTVDHVGTDAGRDRRIEGGVYEEGRTVLHSTADDIKSFLAGIDSKEQSARTITRNSELERADRDIKQERLGVERSKEIKTRSHEYSISRGS